jgi:predicted nucleotidyltransferase
VTERWFSKDAQDFLRVLAKHGVRYLLIGGIAVIHHGYSRLTADVDVLYDCSPQNAERLWRALLEFWSGAVPSVASAAELENPNIVVQFGRPPNRIDLIASLRTVPFDRAWAARIESHITVDGDRVPIAIIGLQDLRQAKREAGRPKDLDDLRHLPES